MYELALLQGCRSRCLVFNFVSLEFEGFMGGGREREEEEDDETSSA
jgi:hypothetical protein